MTFRWVKGHSGDPMNDLVDRLAVEAAVTQQGRTGVGEPGDLGPPDAVGHGAAGAGPDAARRALAESMAPVGGETEPALAGHPLVVFGHRPTELGGYDDDNPVARALTDRLAEIISAKASLVDELIVVSGLRLGAEMLGAEAALAVGVPLVAVLPYPDPESVWPAASQERFRTLRDQARQVIELQRRVPSSKQQAGAALARRDAWLIRNAVEAIVVWDGQDPALGKLVRSARGSAGRRRVAGRPGRARGPEPMAALRVVSIACVGSDTGGTFTDLVAADGRIVKVPSTPGSPGAGGGRRPASSSARSRPRSCATARRWGRTRCSSGGGPPWPWSPTRASPT